MNSRKLFTLAGAACALLVSFAAFAQTSAPEGWLIDYDKAVRDAKATKRPVVILFTGSDWCSYCIRLRKDVISQKEFETYAEKNLILLYVDFPRRAELPKEQAAKNQALAKKYKVSGFPTTIVLSPEGKNLGKIVGYRKDYVYLLQGLVEKKPAKR